MRLIDADELMERLRKRFYAHDLKSDFDRCARSVILSCMEAVQRAETICEPPNDPLTLDELRGMDGEPVYARYTDGAGEWGLVITHGFPREVIRFKDGFLDVDGKHGLFLIGAEIFRRKPEEEPNERPAHT